MPETKRHLSLYLMKPGTAVDQAIGNLNLVKPYNLSSPRLNGILFLRTNDSTVPWWVAFLDPLTQVNISVPSSRTTSGVLCLRLARAGPYARTVCYTFGHGHHLLSGTRVERAFGLRIALNSVDHSKLRGFDLRRLEDIVVNARVQSGVGTELHAFDIDADRDMLTKAAGLTSSNYSADLGQFVRGSDGVTFDLAVDPHDLAGTARKLLSVYWRQDYKSAFGFVDNVKRADSDVVRRLNCSLMDRLNVELAEHYDSQQPNGVGSEFRCLYLASPEVLELEKLEGFVFSNDRGRDEVPHADLALTNYLATRRKRSQISLDSIKRHSVLVQYGGEVQRRLSSVYACIVAETEYDNQLFQLVDGTWYQFEKDYVNRIRNDVGAIRLATFDSPKYHAGEHESSYNSRFAESHGGLVMDRKLVSIGGGRNRMEICDVALLDHSLVHAKRRYSSSALSHLWYQGTVAMRSLLSDHHFRKRVQLRVDEQNPGFAGVFADDVPVSDFEIVYLILGIREDQSIPDALPFFSQVALTRAKSDLTSMGVKIAICGIPYA